MFNKQHNSVSAAFQKIGHSILVLLLAFSAISVVTAQYSHSAKGEVIVSVPEYSLFDAEPDATVDLEDDEKDAPFRVFLRSANRLMEMPFRKSGNFQLSVPSNVYEILLRSNSDESLNYKRANFLVRPGEVNKIEIAHIESEQEVCDEDYGFVVEPIYEGFVQIGGKSKYQSARFDVFPVSHPFKMVVKYCKKMVRNNQITYSFALVTYKNIKIYARNAVFNKKDLILRGSGEVEGKINTSVGDCMKIGGSFEISLGKKTPSKFICDDLQVGKLPSVLDSLEGAKLCAVN